MKTISMIAAALAVLMTTSIANAGWIKNDKPCGSRGAELCKTTPPTPYPNGPFVSTRGIQWAPNHVSALVVRDGQGNIIGTSVYRSWWNY